MSANYGRVFAHSIQDNRQVSFLVPYHFVEKVNGSLKSLAARAKLSEQFPSNGLLYTGPVISELNCVLKIYRK